jgi:hypothetical protein
MTMDSDAPLRMDRSQQLDLPQLRLAPELATVFHRTCRKSDLSPSSRFRNGGSAPVLLVSSL